jgi:hypothetical protein
MPSTVSELSVVELDAIYKIACGEIDPHGPTLEVL